MQIYSSILKNRSRIPPSPPPPLSPTPSVDKGEEPWDPSYEGGVTGSRDGMCQQGRCLINHLWRHQCHVIERSASFNVFFNNFDRFFFSNRFLFNFQQSQKIPSNPFRILRVKENSPLLKTLQLQNSQLLHLRSQGSSKLDWGSLRIPRNPRERGSGSRKWEVNQENEIHPVPNRKNISFRIS